jgi:RecJ-like exonuclease
VTETPDGPQLYPLTQGINRDSFALEKLRRDVANACDTIRQAVVDYHAGQTHHRSERTDGIAEGYGLALVMIAQHTGGEFGQRSSYFPEAS